MIHEHKANGQNYLIVQTNKNAKDFRINENLDVAFLLVENKGFELSDVIKLPSVGYTFLFVAEQANEEQAEMVVGKRDIYRHLDGPMYGKGELCSYSGCGGICDGKYFALLYEGDYTMDKKLGAVSVVCNVHGRDSKDELESLIRTLPDWQQYNHVILLKNEI